MGVDGRMRFRHTLTFAFQGGSAGSVITRPAFATQVWTPDTQTLELNNGGAVNVVVRTGLNVAPLPLGGFTQIALVTDATLVVFDIDL